MKRFHDISNTFDLIPKVQIEPALCRHSQFQGIHWLVPMLLHMNALIRINKFKM